MKFFFFFIFSLNSIIHAEVETVSVVKDISYYAAAEDEYQNNRCKLDLYLPTQKNFATVIWLHGGGLKGGSKDQKNTIAIGKQLARSGVAIAMVNYRLHPKASYPAYVQDTAAAVAWVIGNISKHGGDSKQVFLGGHSAGGSLTLLVGMDPRWLKEHDLKRSDLTGLIPLSAQTMTHYTVRKERYGSDNPYAITADDASPVHYAWLKGIPPTFILWADNDSPARAEENIYLASVLKGAGHTDVRTKEIKDRNHSSIAHHMARPNDSAAKEILDFVKQMTKAIKSE